MSERVVRHQGVVVPAPSPLNALPAPSEGVSLASLLERARRRGLLTVPTFISVSLVQRLCRGLREAPPGSGEVSLESIGVGLDGKVRATASGSAERDLAAAAVLLDRLLGQTVDAELLRIIAEVREPGATALGLEQRLGHWLVKQHQVFPSADLLSELVAWLYPHEVKARGNEKVAAWLDDQRTGPVLEEKPGAATGSRSWLTGLAVIAVTIGVTVIAVRLDQSPASSQPLVLDTLASPAPPRPASPPVVPVLPPAPALPRWGEGAPAIVKLSSMVHGVELETAGFAVTAPASRWAVKTVSATRGPAPRYASLFVVEFDAKHRSTVREVGTSWVVLTRPDARFFAMQTDQPPNDGSFGLAVALASREISEQPKLLRPDVLTDAMTGLEYRRFVLAGLDPKKRYQVTPRGAGVLVVVTATIPHAVMRDMTGAGFQQLHGPLDQALLRSAPVIVKGASRLSFVVLTSKDAPEQLTSVEVKEAAMPRPSR